MKYRVSAFLAAIGVLAGCGGGSREAARHEDAAAAARTFRAPVMEVQPVEWPSFYEAAGTVHALTSSMLASKVMGYVREVKVQTGDHVSAGQLLVLVDARDLDSALLEAKAAEQEAHSGVAEADSGIAAAKAQLDLAQVTFQRMDDLFSKKSISNQEYDEARARLRAAEAGYEMARSKRAQLDARIAKARQGVASASVMKSYSEIRAPFAGVITEKRAEPGQMANPGMPLLTMEQGGQFRLEVPVEESMLGQVKLGQNVAVQFDATRQNVEAKVNEIVPAVDPGSRAFVVKASLPSMPLLRSGLFGRMRVPRGSRTGLVIPQSAVIERGDLQNVFVVEAGKALGRLVTCGERREGLVEILSGLKAGDKVVTRPPEGLVDGAKVEASDERSR